MGEGMGVSTGQCAESCRVNKDLDFHVGVWGRQWALESMYKRRPGVEECPRTSELWVTGDISSL